jgi:peptidoglycan hydrolase FlgJ
MPINSNLQLEQASIYSDLGSLDAIRKQGLNDEVGAIKKAAKEFEAFFMNMMLKSMRQAGEVMGGDSLLSSNEEKMYVGMLDEQLSADLSQKGHLGIAEMMLAQLDNQNANKETLTPQQKKLNDQTELQNHRISPVNNSGADILQAKTGLTAVQANGQGQQSTEQKIESTNWLADKLEQNLTTSRLNKKVESQSKSTQQANPVVSSSIKPTRLNGPIGEVGVPVKKSLFNEIGEFVTTLLPLAEAAAKKLQLDPKVLLAQAALETGWGKHVMHDGEGRPGFNLFGIKASKSWDGDRISINTLEVENQSFKQVNANFRKYDSFSQSFDDYVNFLQQSPRYQKALDAADNANEYVEQLQASGYATDPNYAKKIMRIFNDQSFNQVANQATAQLK